MYICVYIYIYEEQRRTTHGYRQSTSNTCPDPDGTGNRGPRRKMIVRQADINNIVHVLRTYIHSTPYI